MITLQEGDKVNYHAIEDGEITSSDHVIQTIQYEPNNYGCDVAWITRKSGCVAMSHLSKAQ